MLTAHMLAGAFRGTVGALQPPARPGSLFLAPTERADHLPQARVTCTAFKDDAGVRGRLYGTTAEPYHQEQAGTQVPIPCLLIMPFKGASLAACLLAKLACQGHSEQLPTVEFTVHASTCHAAAGVVSW